MNINLVTTSLDESFFESNNFLLGKWCLVNLTKSELEKIREQVQNIL